MKQNGKMTEKSMLAMEARIPELASGATKRAHYQALTTSGKVIKVVNGDLVETSADGTQLLIRHLPPSIAVIPGSIRVRIRSR